MVDTIFSIVIGILIIGCIAMLLFLPFVIVGENEWRDKCEKAGGYPYSGYKSKSLCLNRTTVIEVK